MIPCNFSRQIAVQNSRWHQNSSRILRVTKKQMIINIYHIILCMYLAVQSGLAWCCHSKKRGLKISSWPMKHYSRFEVRLFINRQNMNFGFWKKKLVQIIAEYVHFESVLCMVAFRFTIASSRQLCKFFAHVHSYIFAFFPGKPYPCYCINMQFGSIQ